MRRHFIFALVVCLLTLASCGKSSRNEYFANNSFEDFSSDAETECLYTEVKTEPVTCPICNGLGYCMVSDDIMAPVYSCGICNGNGVCGMETAQQAIQARAQVDAFMNGMDITNDYECGGGGRSASQIEYYLKKAYELLESMEEDYANCDGIVARAQYPPMIARQKERIRELESELRNAR